ncbi:MAG TPA: cation:proton antiporter [Candidatus Acidoferrum sp.]|nr:cation:proton antiporter [Candidatus Acidoferrum sp.]
MHTGISLITTVAASFALALALGLVANRLKLPTLVGYLIAGMLVGPATPGLIVDLALSQQLADIGIILLMFGVGLHFSLGDLLQVRRLAVPGALTGIAVATLLGFALAQWWHWGIGAGLVFGLCLSVASTVVLMRALEQQGILKSVNGHIAMGWLIVEDLAMVLVLVLLPPLAGTLGGHTDAAAGASLWQTLLVTLLKVAVFLVLMQVAGRRVFPWLLAYVAGNGSRELFTLTVIAVAVGIAFASSQWFGVSLALGAFFAGMVMRESPLSHRAANESLPLRDAFSVLFFVSVGMLFDPHVLLQQPLRVLVVVAIILLGKPTAAFLLVATFRYPLNTALTVAAGLSQIGEFSFILAALGREFGLLPADAMNLVLAGALITVSINTFVFRSVEPVQRWIRTRTPLVRLLEKPDDPLAELPMTIQSSEVTGHIVLIGYGRVGGRIGKALLDKHITFVVAEQNREIVEKLRAQGIKAVAGDSAEPAVLIQAHVARAKTLVITLPDTLHVPHMVEVARMLNPDIEVLVRANSEEALALLAKSNIGDVFLGEQEVANSMAEKLLSHK